MAKCYVNNFHLDQQVLQPYILLQGGTYKQICIDMDILIHSLQKNEHFGKLYLKHAHYVSASRVTTLEGLQIIN